MVELQINITDYVHQCCAYLGERFEEFSMELEEFFDELEDVQKCKVGSTAYRVGDVWKDDDDRWHACREGGVIEHDVNPCTLYKLLDNDVTDGDDE